MGSAGARIAKVRVAPGGRAFALTITHEIRLELRCGGERQVRNFFGSHCGGCNDPTNRCVDCSLADKVVKKLETNTVSCSDTDTITFPGGEWGASAPIGGSSIAIYPAFFLNPASYRCMASTLFHEGLHSIGIDHTGPGYNPPGDYIYPTEDACVVAGLCGGGGAGGPTKKYESR